MFKHVVRLVVCSSVFLFSGLGVAADSKTSLIVGYKGWLSTDNTTVRNNGAVVKVESDTDVSSGPILTVRHGRLFAGVNQYQGAYTFKLTDKTFFTDALGTNFVADIKIDRNDTELYVGFDITDNFSLIYGKKEYTLKGRFINVSSFGAVLVPIPPEITFKGDFLAINGHTRMDSRGLIYFFTFTQAKLEQEPLAGGSTSKEEGPTWEIGAAFVPRGARYFFTLSYKQQRYKQDNGDHNEISGLSGSINYVF